MTVSAPQMIKERLSEGGISKVAIIDDSYDLPTADSFNANEIEDFWTTIERDEEMTAELRGLCPNVASGGDIDDQAIRKLWEHRGQLDKLGGPCNDILFATNLQRLSDLIKLRKHLEELGLEIITLDSETELQDTSVKLVFIDYYFEPPGNTNPGGVALNKVRNILALHSEDPSKPFFVLMSGKGGVNELVDKFCNDSGLLKGLFDFMPKSDLSAREKLYIKLGTWAIGMPIRHKIQRFVDALEKSLNSTAKTFIQKVRGLGLEDYSYMKLLSLQEEEHPLGQYIVWLYGPLLTHIAFEANEEVQAEKEVLDQLSFDQFLPSQRAPSIQLAEIYRIALSEPANKLKPRAINESETTPSTHLPDLQFGDLLTKDAFNKVWMVANAPCDLIRASDPNKSILLIPGTLQLLSEEVKDRESPRTELFEFSGNQFRIVWDHKNFLSIRHGDVEDWSDKEGYFRSARLRLPFALQIQQKFATHLTRVGQPVPPPHYELVDVESYYEGEDGSYKALRDPIRNGAFIIHLRNKNNLVFTVECIEALLEEVDKVIERHQYKIDSLDTRDSTYPKKKARLEGKLRNLRACKEDCEILEILQKPWPLDSKKPKELKAHLLCLHVNGNFDGSYTSKLPICLNIKYGSTPRVVNGDVNPTSETSEEVPNN
jgi:hypothetical protein